MTRALFLLADEISYALNELPHPQVDFTFGLLNLNPEPSIVSTKSTWAPSRYSRLAWSTNTFNPSNA